MRSEQSKEQRRLWQSNYRKRSDVKKKINKVRALYRELNKELLHKQRASYWKRNKEKLKTAKNASYSKYPITIIMLSARRSAKARGLPFKITREDLLPLPAECPVLGIKLNYSYGTKSGKAEWNSPSVDRVDNTKGYISGNVKIISWRANKLKSNGSPEELMRVARYAARQHEILLEDKE